MSRFDDDAYSVAVYRDSERRSGLLGRLRLPGFAAERIKRVEDRVLSGIKQRMERLDQPSPPIVLAPKPLVRGEVSDVLTPIEYLQNLLNRSQAQTKPDAERDYFISVLETLLPDHARILSALSDGSRYPLIHVEMGTLFAWNGYALECVSNVGRCSGVQCPELTYRYVQHLRAQGLVDIDTLVDEAQNMKYEILETETNVRQTQEQLKANHMRSRIVRRTLRISDLGRRLWDSCQLPDAPDFSHVQIGHTPDAT